MSNTRTIDELQAAVQAASDRLADALLANGDTSDIRLDLEEARAALQAHQDAQAAADRARQQAEDATYAAQVREAESASVKRHLAVVTSTAAQVELPNDIQAPPEPDLSGVTRAAADVARIQAVIDRGAPARQQAADEVQGLRSRIAAKHASLNAIRQRRMTGTENPSDAQDTALLEADAADLTALLNVALERQAALRPHMDALRKQLAEAEQRLMDAKFEATMHTLAERLRTLETALVAGTRALRGSLMGSGLDSRMPSFWSASPELRKIAYGIPA